MSEKKFDIKFNVEKVTFQSQFVGGEILIVSFKYIVASYLDTYEAAESYIEENIKIGEYLSISKIYVGKEKS